MRSPKGPSAARRAKQEAAARAAYLKNPAWFPQRLTWGFTTRMLVGDLSRDDDFLSHVLVEKLGTGDLPLMVHKMNNASRAQRTDAIQLLDVVRRVRVFSLPRFPSGHSDSSTQRPQRVTTKNSVALATRQAVDDLLQCVNFLYPDLEPSVTRHE
jgi:hypothetical protein